MRHDLLSDVLSAINNGERLGKRKIITSSSNLVKEILLIMQRHGFIGNFEFMDDGKGGKFEIELAKKINRCGAIRPRHAVGRDEYEKWERRFLPAAGFGLLIVSTPQGIKTHEEAKKAGTGGKLLAFVY